MSSRKSYQQLKKIPISSYKERIFIEMTNYMKIFSVLIAIALIIIIIINICESAKRDFQLKDILNFFQKDKKEAKGKNDIVVISGKKREDHGHFHSGPRLVPIPMPVSH